MTMIHFQWLATVQHAVAKPPWQQNYACWVHLHPLAHGSMQGDRVSNEMTFTGALSLKVYLIMKSVDYKIQTSLEDT